MTSFSQLSTGEAEAPPLLEHDSDGPAPVAGYRNNSRWQRAALIIATVAGLAICGWQLQGHGGSGQSKDVHSTTHGIILADSSQQAPPFPNIHLAASGFNVFYSDPMPQQPDDASKVNVDPGLRKPVFAITYSKGLKTGDRRHTRPDGFFVSVDYGCSTVFTTKTISDSFDLVEQNNLDASVTDKIGLDHAFPPPINKGVSISFDGVSSATGGNPIGIHEYAGVSGTLSASQQALSKDNVLGNYRMQRSSAKCAVYSFGVNLAKGDAPETSSEFKEAVAGLSDDDDDTWYKMFDDFGTHFLSQGKMGARYGFTNFFEKAQYDAMYSAVANASVSTSAVAQVQARLAVSGLGEKLTSGSKVVLPTLAASARADLGGGVSVGAGVKATLDGVEAKVGVALDDIPVLAVGGYDAVSKHVSGSVQQGVGPPLPDGGAPKWMESVAKTPVPIRYEKLGICLHPELQDRREKCEKMIGSYCPEYLAKNAGAKCNTDTKKECSTDFECKKGFTCLEFQCREIPKCYVTIYDDAGYKGEQLTVDPVDAVSEPTNMHSVFLENAGWRDRVSSIKLGSGCKAVRVEDDDDGSFGRARQDIEITSSQESLIDDLNDDVKSLIISAKEPEGKKDYEPTPAKDLPEPPRLEFHPGKDVFWAQPREDEVPLALHSGDAEDEYFPNVGKAMYGYNHHYGSPMSVSYAGVDPGFRNRGLWKVTYDKENNQGKSARFEGMPMSPNTQYYVVTAAKSDSLDRMQDKVTDPNPVGYIKSKMRFLLNFCTNRVVKPLVDDDFRMPRSRPEEMNLDKCYNQLGRHYGHPRFGYHPTPEICELLQQVDEARQSFKRAYEKIMKPMYDDVYNNYYVRDNGRRLTYNGNGTDDYVAPQGRRLLDLLDVDVKPGCEYCWQGKVTKWSEEQEKVAAELNEKWRAVGNHFEIEPDKLPLTCVMPVEEDSSSTDGRRLGGLASFEFFDASKMPNMREFKSLAKAKQALRAEKLCIGKSKCGSGFDYDLTMQPEAIEQFLGFDDNLVEQNGLQDERDRRWEGVLSKIRGEWPRFIVKVEDNEVQPVSTIDGQKQSRGLREGFDVQFGDDLEVMLTSVEEYIKSHQKENQVLPRDNEVSTKVPDGWRITKALGGYCESDMKSDMISDSNQFEKAASSSFGLHKTGLAVKGTGLSFGLAYDSKEFLKMNGEESKKMIAVSAECAAYYAELVDLENNPPETEPSFQAVVDEANEEWQYYEIFDMYGLHFPTEVVFGARYGVQQMIERSSFEKYAESSESLNLDFGASVAIPVEGAPGVKVKQSRDTSIGYSASDEQATSVQKYFSETKTFSIGRRMPEGGISEWLKDMDGEPMPIKFDFVPICKHPAFKDKSEQCDRYAKTYCKNHLVREHPDMRCEPQAERQCLWDLDCDVGESCTRDGVCTTPPACDVTLFKGEKTQTRCSGENKILPTYYYKDSRPEVIVDVSVYGWHGDDVKCVELSGGCGKSVLMRSLKTDDAQNKIVTNFKENGAVAISADGSVPYLAVYPKKDWAEPHSKWFD